MRSSPWAFCPDAKPNWQQPRVPPMIDAHNGPVKTGYAQKERHNARTAFPYTANTCCYCSTLHIYIASKPSVCLTLLDWVKLIVCGFQKRRGHFISSSADSWLQKKRGGYCDQSLDNALPVWPMRFLKNENILFPICPRWHRRFSGHAAPQRCRLGSAYFIS